MSEDRTVDVRVETQASLISDSFVWSGFNDVSLHSSNESGVASSHLFSFRGETPFASRLLRD
jgi:hypothetical protein